MSINRMNLDLNDFKAFIFDLDGCIYIGNRILPGARNVIERLRKLDKKILFVTNNATKTPEEFATKLRNFQIRVSADEILTSATATAVYLKENFGKCKIYPVGGKGLTRELQKQGHSILNLDEAKKADTVVACLDFGFTYKKLQVASKLILAGGRFIATNIDPTVPVEDGYLPGAGAIVRAISTSTSKEPFIVGKPSKHILLLAFKKLRVRSDEAVVVGDRLTTDVMGGNETGAFTILLLSGATSVDMLHKIDTSKMTPRLTLPNIGDMLLFLRMNDSKHS